MLRIIVLKRRQVLAVLNNDGRLSFAVGAAPNLLRIYVITLVILSLLLGLQLHLLSLEVLLLQLLLPICIDLLLDVNVVF